MKLPSASAFFSSRGGRGRSRGARRGEDAPRGVVLGDRAADVEVVVLLLEDGVEHLERAVQGAQGGDVYGLERAISRRVHVRAPPEARAVVPDERAVAAPRARAPDAVERPRRGRGRRARRATRSGREPTARSNRARDARGERVRRRSRTRRAETRRVARETPRRRERRRHRGSGRDARVCALTRSDGGRGGGKRARARRSVREGRARGRDGAAGRDDGNRLEASPIGPIETRTRFDRGPPGRTSRGVVSSSWSD